MSTTGQRLQEQPEALRAAAGLLKRLAHPARLMLVCRLVEGEATVAQLEAELAMHQPALSQQLAELRNAGLVEARRTARGVTYRLCPGPAAEVVALVHRCFCDSRAPSPSPANVVGMSAPASPASTNVVPFGAAVFARVGGPASNATERKKP